LKLSDQTIKLVEQNITEINPQPTDRQRVEAWLDSIQEFDAECRAEVLRACVENIGARKYYVGLANVLRIGE
jgi:hypothetical protein